MTTPSTPTVAVLAGINGAGKTSSAFPILTGQLRIPVFVNADAIARGLNAFDVESEAVRAGRIMLEYLDELATSRRSFAFETTLAARTYAPRLVALRAAGYVAHLFYFWLKSPEVAIQRVAERVRSGGHHIPDETIRRRYSRSVRNFLDLYRPVVTTWTVYDNTDTAPRVLATHNGYYETVVDPDRWGLFQRSANDDRNPDGAGR
ncbi:MAG TPA: zeta toxin family protein [Urbifossiella sp.]|nr:zeta toxin family protein [Urbifossiella sp.]